MIRKRVEYVIICDEPDCQTDCMAFNCESAGDCATAAKKEGWQLRSSGSIYGKWLCPKCAEKRQAKKENENA